MGKETIIRQSNLRTPCIIPLTEGASFVEVEARADDRFSVNFINSFADDGNVRALHINLRFDEDVTVLNTKTDGTWGPEERHPLPIGKKDHFRMKVFLKEDKFEIFFNDAPTFEYQARMPMNELRAVCIDENLSEVHVDVPTERKGDKGICGILPEKFKQIKFNALIDDEDSNLALNLFTGPNIDRDTENILLHFNPRFDPDKVLVMNTLIDGEWGEEHRHASNINCGEECSVVINAEQEGRFKFVVNGEEGAEMNMRIPADQARGFQFTGRSGAEVHMVEIFHQ